MMHPTRPRISRLSLLVLAAAALVILPSGCKKAPVPAGAEQAAGYTLIQQLMSRTTDLIDLEGRLVHRWRSKHGLASGARLLANGDLVRTGILENSPFVALLPAIGGVVERLGWDGEVLWSFTQAEPRKTLHHDFEILPNGNLLLIGVEVKAKDELLAAGRDPAQMREDSLWIDYLIEVSPTGDSGGKIVWEWHAWDHLIQDHDAGKKNHGVVSEHPELVNLNFIDTPSPIGGLRLKLLQSVGYVGGGKAAPPGQPPSPEWTHVNSVSYHAERDQIMLTVRNLGEIWIIDHSTSAAEAGGHAGGRHGHGGDLLYRWGNPQAYQRGKPADQKLFGPHNAHWIPAGLPGAGNVLIFNNGEGRRDGAYSAVEEIRIPPEKDGSYKDGGKSFGPDASVWRYLSEPKTAFYSSFLSGSQRLANGNTLICSGMQRKVFEVDQAGRTVWTYSVRTQGEPITPRPPLISILDTNGDGFIDAAEMAQAPVNLKKLDRNGDGVLSIEECLPPPGGGPPGGPGPGGSGAPPGLFGGLFGGLGGAPKPPPLPPIFTVLDSNGDGVIDAAEIAQAASTLLKLDKNGDGRISLEECLPVGRGAPAPPGSPPPLPPLITVFDPDHDGTISAEAVARAPGLLRKLDKNGDGKLTREEYLPPMAGMAPPGGPGGMSTAPPLPPIARALDANGDGIMDAAELAGASAALARLDKNGDGRISLDESLPRIPDAPQKPSPSPASQQGEGAIHGGLFRAVRFGVDHPAIKGRRLTPFGDAPPPKR